MRLSIQTVAALEKLWARMRTGFEVAFDLIVMLAKNAVNLVVGAMQSLVNGVVGAVNTVIGAIERAINAAARAASEVPGVSIGRVSLGDLENVELGTPFADVRSAGEIVRAGERRLTRRDRRIGRQERQADRQLEQRIDQLIGALLNNQQTTTINIDGKQAARQTEPFLGEKTGDQGRFNPL